MLLYALTDRDAAHNEHRQEIGIDLYCYTLDLGRDFKEIAVQLDAIAGLVGRRRIEALTCLRHQTA